MQPPQSNPAWVPSIHARAPEANATSGGRSARSIIGPTAGLGWPKPARAQPRRPDPSRRPVRPPLAGRPGPQCRTVNGPHLSKAKGQRPGSAVLRHWQSIARANGGCTDGHRLPTLVITLPGVDECRVDGARHSSRLGSKELLEALVREFTCCSRRSRSSS